MERTGECNRCGRCCKMATLQGLNNFLKAARRAGHPPINMPCPHLTLKDGVYFCSNYENRPEFCRKFPGELSDIKNIPQCGYRFEEPCKKD